ncbi:MAG: rRNA maturation RNase YbeY [Nitrospirae bacterium]|nr:rRNA maturation RNase YbeY [Nitrospirota bacterium]
MERVELSILLVNDRMMKSLNENFRGIDKTTDVLSFPMYCCPEEFPRDGEILLGDVAVSLDTATAQAQQYGETIGEEVLRLLVHGLFHLIGYDHEKSPCDAREMARREMELLNALEEMDK